MLHGLLGTLVVNLLLGYYVVLPGLSFELSALILPLRLDSGDLKNNGAKICIHRALKESVIV